MTKILKRSIYACLAMCVAAFLLTGCGETKVPVYQEILQESEAFESANEVLKTESESSESEGENGTEVDPEGSDEALESVCTESIVPSQKPEEYEIQLMMVGDNLLHMGIVRTGQQKDGSYNFDFLFEGIEAFLDEAEIKMINQETIFGGNELGFSGYPRFNSPTEVGDAIAKAGFNVVLHASNHAADKGIEGLTHCVEYWKGFPEVKMAGIHEQGASPIQILTIEDIDFAILNYTYGPNLAALPASVKGHLDMLCDYDEDTGAIDFTSLHPDVLTDIAEAKEMADVVIVCPHWGTEYTTKPSVYQKRFALQMTQAGADIIIGTHPHVVQPVEWIEAENGNRALCYYSLGNYVSTQKDPLCMLEAMAWISFRVSQGEISINEEGTGVLPMVCHYKAGPVRLQKVYLLENYTEELSASHGIKSYGKVDLPFEHLHTWSQEVFGENILTSEEALGRGELAD